MILATIIQDTAVLSFDAFGNSSALCPAIRNPAGAACPYGPGSFALGITVPLTHSYPLTTIRTRLRILDTSQPSQQLACYDIQSTPFYPSHWSYLVFLWVSAGVAILYALTTWVGRIWGAHTTSISNREAELASSLTAKLSPKGLRESLGPVFWDAAAGATLQASASLRRFATPGVTDVVWAAQWVAILGMVAVDWPQFACELSCSESCISTLVAHEISQILY